MITTNDDPGQLQVAALAAVANAVVITDRDGRIEWVNPAFTRLSGYPEDEAVGDTLRLLSSGVHPPEFYADLWETILAGRVWRGDVVERHRDGHLYTVAQTITPLHDADAAVTHFIAVHEDVSEARASQRRLHALFENAHDAILLADDDGWYVDANPAACELTGYGREELCRMRVTDLAAPSRISASVGRQCDAFRSHGTEHGDFPMQHRSGRVIETEYRAVPNVLPGLHASIMRDVTARNASLRALRASESTFRSLAENASDVVALLRVDDGLSATIEYVNPAASRLCQQPIATGDTGASLLGCAHPDDAGTLERLLRTAASEQRTGVVRVTDSAGHTVWLEAVVTAVEETSTHRTLQVIARDVTGEHRTRAALRAALEDQRAAAETLETLNETKNRLLRNISHELRTPVTSVVGFAETLSRGELALAPAQVDEVRRSIRRNADRIRRLLDDLTDIDRSLRGATVSRRTPTDLADLVTSTVQLVELADRPLALDVDSVVVPVEPAKIRRMIDNLLTNAVRHTPPGTHITIRLHATADGAQLTVEDDGPGIPRHDQAQLFEPFHQGEDAGHSPRPGLGLGLSVVRACAEAHGGSAWLDPTQPGVCVHVLLPSSPAVDEPA